jgi:hypothetical protein
VATEYRLRLLAIHVKAALAEDVRHFAAGVLSSPFGRINNVEQWARTAATIAACSFRPGSRP